MEIILLWEKLEVDLSALLYKGEKMRGLRKYLTPFAPDQSGAVSVLFELGGIIVICDAGGCTGNVCGFDEPRWFKQKVRSSVPDFEIWMQFSGGMIVW